MVSYLNLSRDGTRLAAGGYGSAGVGDYFVTVIWDLKIPRPVGNALDAYAFTFSPHDQSAASFSQDGTRVLLWDTRTWERVALSVPSESETAYAITFSPDGKTLAASFRLQEGANQLLLWDVVSHRQRLLATGGHQQYVHTLAFTPDGTRLASMGYEISLRSRRRYRNVLGLQRRKLDGSRVCHCKPQSDTF